MKAYVTILSTKKYLEGVLALKKGLDKVHSLYPLYVVVNEEIEKNIEELLEKYDIKVIHRNSIKVPVNIKKENNELAKDRWNYTFDKLNVFSLTQFEKIVFLDSDLYIRSNIDMLFEKENMSAVIDKYEEMDIQDNWIKLTSGVMVITPKENTTKELVDIMIKMGNKRGTVGDQDVLQEYDKQWEDKKELHLDNKFNIFFPFLDYYISHNMCNLNEMKVFHFIYPKKPWFFPCNNKEEYLNYINNFTKEDMGPIKIEKLGKYIFYNNNENKRKILEEYYKILEDVRKTLIV